MKQRVQSMLEVSSVDGIISLSGLRRVGHTRCLAQSEACNRSQVFVCFDVLERSTCEAMTMVDALMNECFVFSLSTKMRSSNEGFESLYLLCEICQAMVDEADKMDATTYQRPSQPIISTKPSESQVERT